MPTSLDSGPIASTLQDLYAAAEAQRSGPGHRRKRDSAERLTAQQRADGAADAYMPIDREAGRLLYSLIRATRPATVVEFGTSFGISTLHLAAAVRDNGFGRVVTTEMNAHKVAAASATFEEVGVSDLVTVLNGDAVKTLDALDGTVEFVLLDGWKELYEPVLKVLEARLPVGTLIAADNASHSDAGPYLEYVRNPAHGYVTFNFPSKRDDSMELSVKV
ncbi:class I SAM-dependent methyltransferase [Rhodococcus sp. 14-2483-1-2]|uniref:O-methyltransferase n=1 Tax=Rhodococcus sp. 14-2483-1-2 TaxID=2023147 RepID=UPI000B9B8EBF|nr:class I SAM-dependent methyltransferase [Rhodococcus sp. 14-2483-1-2]OZF26095.1 methyltransferase [Rhodococcus sp. 14-2483-1-2]